MKNNEFTAEDYEILRRKGVHTPKCAKGVRMLTHYDSSDHITDFTILQRFDVRSLGIHTLCDDQVFDVNGKKIKVILTVKVLNTTVS